MPIVFPKNSQRILTINPNNAMQFKRIPTQFPNNFPKIPKKQKNLKNSKRILKIPNIFQTFYLWCSWSCFSTVIFNIRFLVLILVIPIRMVRVRGAFSKYFINSSKPSRSSKSALALQPSRLVDRQKTVSWPCSRVTCGGFVWWSPTVGVLNCLKTVQDSCPGTKYRDSPVRAASISAVSGLLRFVNST